MRVTIKRIGIQSEAATRVKPGTRVFVEGPYGTFTSNVRTARRVVLIGAGVGVTPVRALLEDLPTSIDVTVIVRASSYDDIVHRQEIADLVKNRKGVMHEIVGPRSQVRLDAKSLRKLVGNLGNADVYVCGPSAFADTVVRSLSTLGARAERIHQETFSF
jgi:ferredoxin-NADP reductase